MVYIKCCHHCDKRTPTCHSTCERYLKEKVEGKEIAEKIKKMKSEEKDVQEVRSLAFNLHQRKKHGG